MPHVYRQVDDRHPYEVYLLVFTLATSLPALAGLTNPPRTIQLALQPWEARVWAGSLALGALVALVGLAWRRPPKGLPVTGLVLEQIGLAFIGAGTIFYSWVALRSTGLDAIQPIGVVLAFGVASFAQSWKISGVLNRLAAAEQNES